MELQTIILYGRSGSGKGTQGRLIEEHIKKNDPEQKVLYVETGNGLREFAKRDIHTAHLTKDVLEQGGLIPVFLPIWVWTGFLIENFSNTEHIIFDGVARRLDEAPVLDSALEFYSRNNPTIIHLDVSRNWAFKRLKERGRYDDDGDDINKRLDWYDENVVPAIQYFKDNDRYTFLNIDGEHTINEIHQDIIKKLGL